MKKVIAIIQAVFFGSSIIYLVDFSSRIKIYANQNDSDLISSDIESKVDEAPSNDSSGVVNFSFNAFGDSGWSRSHVSTPIFSNGFRKAYLKFNPSRKLLGDINYINWESSVGKHCDVFWSKPQPSHYAFLTHPGELGSAINLGFNLIGLANNHTYDCLRSFEGNGPLQTLSHVRTLQGNLRAGNKEALFSGVFQSAEEGAPEGWISVSGSAVPVRFLSAYVGGNLKHCGNMVCDMDLNRYKSVMASQKGLRVLALHSWNQSSHQRLKNILLSWLKMGLVDVAIGSGPHVAGLVSIVNRQIGPGVLATSLGNFIHPSLGRQKNNIVLQTEWRYDNKSSELALGSVSTTIVSCEGESCHQGLSKVYSLPKQGRRLDN